MKQPSNTAAGHFVTICLFFSISTGAGQILQLSSSGQIPAPQTITFDGYPHHTVANNLYQNLGISFSRDDGQPVYIYDWSALGRVTQSPPDVLATTATPTANFASHLNVVSSTPLYSLGAYFGNDQYPDDFSFVRLTVYGPLNQLIGSVQVPVNNNTSVDQFIGIQSNVPFVRARFENFSPLGFPSSTYAVNIDNLSFSVPEPTSLALLGLGGLILIRCRRSGKVVS